MSASNCAHLAAWLHASIFEDSKIRTLEITAKNNYPSHYIMGECDAVCIVNQSNKLSSKIAVDSNMEYTFLFPTLFGKSKFKGEEIATYYSNETIFEQYEERFPDPDSDVIAVGSFLQMLSHSIAAVRMNINSLKEAHDKHRNLDTLQIHINHRSFTEAVESARQYQFKANNYQRIEDAIVTRYLFMGEHLTLEKKQEYMHEKEKELLKKAKNLELLEKSHPLIKLLTTDEYEYQL